MDREREEYYIDFAADNPEMLCSEAPDEILEACAAEAEPTAFMEEFLATGHSQWILLTYRRRLPQSIINNNILQLWLRACRLHTRRLMNEPDPDWDKPFFSVEEMTVV